MNRTLDVFLAIVMLAVSTLSAQTTTTPTLLKGVSVEMAVTTRAQRMPDADAANAWIVAITFDGSLYFGLELVPRAGLVDALTRRPRDREQKLYIKADARAPFSAVETVLEAAHTAQFDAPVLLTSQPEAALPGSIVPPRGLEVWTSAPTSPDSLLVQMSHSSRQAPIVKVNQQTIPASVLQSTIDQLLGTRGGQTVVLKADGQLPFAQVVRLIDLCSAPGTKVVVATPEP